MRVFIGWDSNEVDAYQVAESTLTATSSLTAEPLRDDDLRAHGLLTRSVDKRGQTYDIPSCAPCSTEFAASRFLVPILCRTGPALFTDCDMVFMRDVRGILDHYDETKAVMVVKHHHEGSGVKMGGLQQTCYNRKNWSSVMLFNCDHPANRRLSVRDVNERPGRDLHALYWLHDSEIGELPPEYNWLVNVTEKPDNPVIAHFTLGGPWIDGWEGAEHDEIWLNANG